MSLREERRERWSRLLDEHQKSGLPVSEWCRARGIHPTSFFDWRRKLGWQPKPSSGPEWVEVTAIAASAPADGAQITPIDAGSCLTLRMGTISIDLRSGFDHGLLRDVLDVLGQRAC